ncbi:MAG: hypothetical protein AAF911_07620, partial [Planctomycetota bacterium]
MPTTKSKLPENIASNLKDTPEQTTVVGPLVAHLVKQGWALDQIVFGRNEWRIPKSPSQATKREKTSHLKDFPSTLRYSIVKRTAAIIDTFFSLSSANNKRKQPGSHSLRHISLENHTQNLVSGQT